MRFGSFVFTISGDPDNDQHVIERTLREVELAEEVGLDAVWLTEHHFDGAVAYADPVVFAAAVAARTSRIRIGFAVVEMALHHPVRLAAQTALLDNLSKGRLIMGTGRGSAFNEYEYIGFGQSMEDSREMLPEAEELLIKAWTEQDVNHQGRFWHGAFPLIRPRPYQHPHPLMVRACISEPSMREMARIGRPVLIGVQTIETLKQRLQLYRDTMMEAGFTGDAVEATLDQCWAQRGLCIRDSDEEAVAIASEGLGRYRKHLMDARVMYNPGGVPQEEIDTPRFPAEYVEHAFLAGTPETVAEGIHQLKQAGVRNLMLNFNVGELTSEQVENSLRMFGSKVLPQFSD